MHDEAALIEARIERVLGHSVLWEMVGDSHPFEVEAWEVPGEPVTLAEALDATFTPFAIGSTFSRPASRRRGCCGAAATTGSGTRGRGSTPHRTT